MQNVSNMENMDAEALKKSVPHVVVEIIEYVPNAVVSRTIMKRLTGNITALSFDAGEEIGEKRSPFDTYIQIIDGSAQVIISGVKNELKLGQGIIIPAHASHFFFADQQFKMLSTIIKSGYED